jgi:hypothetical protein
MSRKQDEMCLLERLEMDKVQNMSLPYDIQCTDFALKVKYTATEHDRMATLSLTLHIDQ